MWQEIIEPHHLLIIIGVLILALILMGGGRGLGKIIDACLSRLSGKTTEVNLTVGEEMAKPKIPCATCAITDPASCPLHQSEHERSLRNEKSITELWENFGKLRDEMTLGFKELQKSITTSQQTILTALSSRPRGEK